MSRQIKLIWDLGGGYTFLLVTDRTELDTQIYNTFTGVGAVQDVNVKATSGEHLKALLKTDQRYIFSLIHKFNFDEVFPPRQMISQRSARQVLTRRLLEILA